MKKNIAIFTFTRAEYGLYKHLFKRLQNNNLLNCKLFVGGTHLLDSFGNSVNEIKSDGFEIAGTLDFLQKTKDEFYDILKSISKETELLTAYFKKKEFDYLIVLGDRWELIPLVFLAVMSKVIIIHLGGGENTLGAIDNQIRHAITKMAHFHFVANEHYAENVSRMGEEDWRIAIFGAPGLENIKNMNLYSYSSVIKKFNLINNKPYFLVTYHPETITEDDNFYDIHNIFLVLEKNKYQAIITYPNLEIGSDRIIQYLQNNCAKNKLFHLYKSLGMKWYLSAMKYSSAVIGNSSSGIIEAPFLKVHTINVGSRQDGRLLASSIIQVNNIHVELEKTINKVLFDEDFRHNLKYTKSLYGNGRSSRIVEEKLNNIIKLPKEKLLLKKFDKNINKDQWNSL